MDQKQARPQTVSRARARESANGNAVGLPHLQPAAVGQTAKNWFPGSCDLLKRDRTIRSAHNQKRNKSETLHPTKTLQIDGFFTASRQAAKGRPPGMLRQLSDSRSRANRKSLLWARSSAFKCRTCGGSKRSSVEYGPTPPRGSTHTQV